KTATSTPSRTGTGVAIRARGATTRPHATAAAAKNAIPTSTPRTPPTSAMPVYTSAARAESPSRNRTASAAALMRPTYPAHAPPGDHPKSMPAGPGSARLRLGFDADVDRRAGQDRSAHGAPLAPDPLVVGR